MADRLMVSSLHQRSGLLHVSALAYVCLIAYGSLFPFNEWVRPQGSLFDFLRSGLEHDYSSSDFVVNILVYIPVGALFFLVLKRKFPAWTSAVLALLAGSALSLCMETLQGFVPIRVSSVGDWVVNTISVVIGTSGAWLFYRSACSGGVIARLQIAWVRPGTACFAGIWVGLLAFAMLVGTLAPSLSNGEEALWLNIFDSASMTFRGWLEYVLMATSILLLIGICLRKDRPVLPLLAGGVAVVMLLKFVMAVLYLKVPVAQWSVSTQSFSALTFSILLVGLLLKHRGFAWMLAVGGLVMVYCSQQLLPWTYSTDHFRAMNLVPFAAGHMHGGDGLLAVVDNVLMFVVLGMLFAVITPRSHSWPVGVIGGLAVMTFGLSTEWLQQYMIGRYSDVSDIGLSLVGWCLAWVWSSGSTDRAYSARTERARSRRIWFLGLGCVASVVVMFVLVAGNFSLAWNYPLAIEKKSGSSQVMREHFGELSLTEFRFEHPRLLAPTDEDISLLRKHNPAYLSEMLYLAQGGDGQLEASITMAFIEPGSQNIDRIFERLMDEPFVYRGNGTELVARGYDWLYDQLTDEQRLRLREHVFAGFDFTYRVIREDRFSPYNVFWYNSPFQRLLAAAIVLYDEDERGIHAMQVANHMLKEQMLPVWRQIMGRNGGWHEGGEYVGIGVGQAVWQVPAMWRHATGEDLFASETYLRGFLDFLIYRQRPDSTDFRWGDARHFRNFVPDRYALAFEYEHLAAMWPKPPAYQPNSWPWGPLISPVSAETVRAARDAMPLSRLFDGIGMLVARSDWTADATYLTFKAGDNYWSHSHLDQGAFTLYKGGPLAIDSGLYGPGYGSKHHMNYTYQTIAHNTITVQDPSDNLLWRRAGATIEIANDGGQRRVGSGWGEHRAPNDLDDWRRLKEVYHTGRIVHVHEDSEFAIAVSDITPAYTNQHSGQSTFHHRTRRVERAWRTVAYDRQADVVVVYDDVASTRPEFRKRWLLHTLEEPVLGRDGFKVWITPGDGEGRAGGRLEGQVIYPENAQLVTIGGAGLEFFVDGVNYDEQGEVAKVADADPRVEPGSWRIEVMPGEESIEDRFLVVMFPRLIHGSVSHRVERLQDGERVGVLIEGAGRAVRWWFRPGQLGVEVEVRAADGSYREVSLY